MHKGKATGRRFTEQGASEYLSERFGLKRTPKTLATLRSQRRGPRYFKSGKDVFYIQSDLDRYAEGIPFETRDSLSLSESRDVPTSQQGP